MIELFCRTYLTPYPSGEWHDEALYIGEDREEAQAAFLSHFWAENEVAIWNERKVGEIPGNWVDTRHVKRYTTIDRQERLS